MLLAQGVAGAAKAGYGAWQKSKGKKALAGAYQAPTGTPTEYADLIKQARASEISKRRIDEINKTMATSTSALQQAGSRGVIGGIGAVTAAGSTAKTAALTQQQQEIMEALGTAVKGAELQRQRDVTRQTREEDSAMDAISAGQENLAGGLGEVLEAGVGFGQARSEGLIKTKKKPSKSTVAPSLSIKKGELNNAFNTETNSFNLAEGAPLGDVGMGTDMYSTEQDLEELIREGYLKKYGGVQKTPGKFSHETNPIDIMKDGAKIGEMTGGEYIFNPSQAKNLQKLAKSGNSDLHKFVRTLLNKPQFK